MSQYTYERDRHTSAEATVNAWFADTLGKDPDVQQALSTIRNAERAIATRAAELDDPLDY